MGGSHHDQGPALAGVHHVSALSAHIARTHAFHTRVLGLRPLVRTVNQDDPRMYHLFYGDGAGSVGSDFTVFDMPRAARERRGHGAVSLTTHRVAGEATLAWWAERLRAHGVQHAGLAERDGRLVLEFDDPEGTRLSLVDDGGDGPAHPWERSPVPAEHQIRGLGYTAVTVAALEPTDRFLREALGFRRVRDYALPESPAHRAHVYVVGDDARLAAEQHVIVRDDLPRARYGAGAVHHVALRVPDGGRIDAWVATLDALGYRNSGVVDRHWFASTYVREPGGVLFELATDAPGFDADGPLDGERLSLPPFLEPRRAEIEAALAPIDLPADAAPDHPTTVTTRA